MVVMVITIINTEIPELPNSHYRSEFRSRKAPMPGSFCFTASSTSPTCRLTEISSWCGLFSLLCKMYLIPIVNPREPGSLMTAGCYCRGSDELDSRLRCR